MASEALVIVDFQNDFSLGGSLGVPASEQIVETINDYGRHFVARGALLVATRDWHPPVTDHFQEHGGPWPVHCVQGTKGAEFHPSLRLPEGTVIVSKGTHYSGDSYSAFHATLEDGTALSEYLRLSGVRHLYIGGLATDYCVRASVLDGLREGYEVTILLDASRGVDVEPGDSEKALAEMVSAGANVATLARLREHVA